MKLKLSAKSGTYAGNSKVTAEIEHVGWLIAYTVASPMLSSASAPINPAAVLARVTLEY